MYLYDYGEWTRIEFAEEKTVWHQGLFIPDSCTAFRHYYHGKMVAHVNSSMGFRMGTKVSIGKLENRPRRDIEIFEFELSLSDWLAEQLKLAKGELEQ